MSTDTKMSLKNKFFGGLKKAQTYGCIALQVLSVAEIIAELIIIKKPIGALGILSRLLKPIKGGLKK